MAALALPVALAWSGGVAAVADVPTELGAVASGSGAFRNDPFAPEPRLVDAVGSRLLAEEPERIGTLFRQLAGLRSAARASARLDGSDGNGAEFFMRNADNPSEVYALGGFHKYAFLTGSPLKWPSLISWRYNPAGQSTLFSQSGVLAALTAATQKWEAVCNVRFSYAGTTTGAPSMSSCDGQNIVGWAPLAGGTVGRAQVCYSGSSLTEFDMVLDNEQPYQLSSLSLTESVATHEFGHVIGLGHTSISPAVMTSSVTTGTLVQDDIDGCVALYGPAASTTTPAASFSMSSVAFGSQTVGTTSPAQTVRITNSGGGTLSLSSLGVSGANASDFNRAGTCSSGTSLGGGQFCDVTLTFSPLASGTRTATLNVSSNATGSPHAIPLSGTGADPVPVASLSVTALAFASQNVGTTSAAKTVRVTNTGSGTLSISSLGLGGTHPGDFARSGCAAGTSLAAGAWCDASVTFTPTASGTRSATLSIATNAAGSPANVALSGSGVAVAPVASLSAASIVFGDQVVGTTSTVRSVTLSNTGNATLQIASIAKSGANSAEFVVGGSCPSSGSLAAGASCSVQVQFTPVGSGSRSASVSITTNAAGSPHAIALSGNGVTAAPPPAPQASLSSSALAFPSQLVGTTSAAQSVTLSNTGNAALTVSSVTVQGANAPDFPLPGVCAAGTSLAPGASCAISATFRPTAAGSRAASIVVATNGGNPAVAMSGTGVEPAPVASLSPLSLAFGTVNIGSQSATQSVRLTNTGGGSLTVTGVSVGGANAGEFSWSGGCVAGGALAAGQGCDLYVAFAPTSGGSKAASLDVATSVAAPISVALSGSGADASQPPIAKFSATLINFRDQKLTTTSRVRSVSLVNNGQGVLVVQQVTLGGANSSDFELSSSCAPGTTLGYKKSCSIGATFSPRATGLRTGQIVVYTNASAAATAIVLSGNGVAASTSAANKAAVADVVEYYHPSLDHYFITMGQEETAALDSGRFSGWERTGELFGGAYSQDGTRPTSVVINSATQAPPAQQPTLYGVCRFYGNPARGLDSHFYSASPVECSQVLTRFADDWQLEGEAVMYAYLPDAATGACPATTAPLYRLWNQRRDSNHRYTVDPAVRDEMIARGWLSEGYGKAGVAMCLPAD